MPFSKNDPNINRQGRIPKSEENKFTRAEIRDKEFISMLRKVKPHLAKAVQAAVKILDDDEATENGKLRASALIIQTYKDLVKEVYAIPEEDGDDEKGAPSVDGPKAPLFSLTMIEGQSQDKPEETKE